MMQLHAAVLLESLKAPPGNKLLRASWAIDAVSTASGSTINGACALSGRTRARKTSRSRIATERSLFGANQHA